MWCSSLMRGDMGLNSAMAKKGFLTPALFAAASAEIPPVSSLLPADKAGYLLKLTGKGFLYPGTWKKRYCVLKGTRFYYYEKEDSKGSEKSSGVINLEYYDLCEAASGKDSKKAPNVFLISASDKTFFDSSKYLFSAETLTEMNDWLRRIQRVMCKAKGVRRLKGSKAACALSASTPTSPNIGVIKAKHEEKFATLEMPSSGRLYTATKHRAKGPKGRRLPQRKSMGPRTKLNYTDETGSQYIIDHRMRANSLSALEMDSSLEGGHPENWLTHSIDLEENISQGSSNPDVNYQYSSSDESLVHEVLKQTASPNPEAGMNGTSTVHNQNAYNLRSGGNRQSNRKEAEYIVPHLGWAQGADANSAMAETIPTLPQSGPGRRDEEMGYEPTTAEVKKTNNLVQFLNHKMAELCNALAVIKTDVHTAQKDVGVLQGDLEEAQTFGGSISDRLDKLTAHVMHLEKQHIRNLKDVESMADKARVLVEEAEKAKQEYTAMKEECEAILSRLRVAEGQAVSRDNPQGQSDS